MLVILGVGSFHCFSKISTAVFCQLWPPPPSTFLFYSNLCNFLMSVWLNLRLPKSYAMWSPRVGFNIMFLKSGFELYGPFSEKKKWKMYSGQWCEGTWWLAVARSAESAGCNQRWGPSLSYIGSIYLYKDKHLTADPRSCAALTHTYGSSADTTPIYFLSAIGIRLFIILVTACAYIKDLVRAQ